jgi:hypothetical protein
MIQYLAVTKYFKTILESYKATGEFNKMKSSISIASILFDKEKQFSYRARSIRQWADHYYVNNTFQKFRQGVHTKTFTIIINEGVQETLKTHLRNMTKTERTPLKFMNLLNDSVLRIIQRTILRAPNSVNEDTARRWMRILGFFPSGHKKGYFVDGHEREDVVEHRKRFLAEMMHHQRLFSYWEGENMDTHIRPTLMDGEQEIVLIVQDECIIYTNDANKIIWEENSKKELRPKSNGRSLHISGFTCACHGFCDGRTATIMKPGKNADGYWTNKDLVEQLEIVIKIFEELHPNCKLLFAFDNSQNHHARAPDALYVKNINLSDGGKAVKMLRNTVWNDRPHLMQTAAGKQKGVKTILEERGLYPNHKLLLECDMCKDSTIEGPRTERVSCCGRGILGSCDDFKESASKIWLQEIAEKYGHSIIFFPKFHCELNFIEMIWAYIKDLLRRDCSFSYKDLQVKVPEALFDVPQAFVKKVSRHCFRFMDAYRHGLPAGPIADYAMKKFSGHRRLPPNFVVADLVSQYEEHKSKKARK